MLKKIQKAVDDLSLHQYSNLPQWVAKVDKEVEGKLAARLQAGIKAWVDALQERSDITEGKKSNMDMNMDTDAPVETGHKLGGEPQIKV